MATGPGKYDDICTEAAKAVGVTDATGGGVVLLVLGGNKGDGFEVHASFAVSLQLPALLRSLAASIEADILAQVGERQ